MLRNNLPLFPESPAASEGDTLYYESEARRAGYRFIAGIDEAGRGPLAGPVVAAAVIVPEGVTFSGIKDSKQMTEKAREEAFSVIEMNAVAIGIGVVSHRYIDENNILQATLEAMRRAVFSLDPAPDYLLIDGIHPIPSPVPQKCLKGGDRRCFSISAASVMAKVYRDRIMRSFHDRYPVYGFLRNKGYGTAGHLNALREYGPAPLHRLTFRGVLGEKDR